MIILSITALEAVMDRSVGKLTSELDIKLDIGLDIGLDIELDERLLMQCQCKNRRKLFVLAFNSSDCITLGLFILRGLVQRAR